MKQQESRTEAIGKTSASVPQSESERVTSSAPGTTAGQKEQPGKWAVMATVAIGVFMATLDSSIVNISLPTVAQYFKVPLGGAIEWVIIAYLVATASALLTAGRLADMIGRKVVWTAGLIVFTTGSALCGASLWLVFLVGARALQGLGGALLMAISPALITSAFPANERGKALGLNAIIVALGVSVGPTLGGLITAYFSWRWIFYVNVPIGIIGLIATVRVLKEPMRRSQGRFDPWGALLLAVGLAAITAGLSFGQELGWTSPLLVSLLVTGIASLVILPFVETRVADPIIDLSMFHNRVFLSANLSLVLSFLALFAVGFMLPFYFEELRGFPTEQAGLLLTPFPITLAIIAPFSGSLADRFGTRWLAAGGLTIACIGLVLIGQLNEKSSIWDIVWRLVLTGAGQAIFQSPNNSALLGSAPRQRQGIASGFLATGRTMGQSLSVALAGTIFAALGGAQAGSLLSGGQPGQDVSLLQHIFVHSFQVSFIVSAAIAAIGIFASLVRGKEQMKRPSSAKG
ncbi:MAG TPA: MFS transporter [Ktedonobacteraceae bacterium]|nr:MFS transporter [Ktedonobacteraceae bacterium]